MPDGHKAKGKPWRLDGQLAAVDREIAKLEGALQTQSRWAEQWGLEVERPEPERFLERIVQKVFGNWRLRHLDWQLGGSRPLWKSTEKYHHALEERSRLIAELLQETSARRIQQMLRHHRRDLRKFLRAIRARSDAKQEKLFSEISLEVLFGTFPIWLTTMADASEVLPLQPELFDLVIIDEAMTQRPETADLPCVRLRHIPDGQKVRGMNDREAQALVDEVGQRVEAEAGLPEEVCHSLGILSPFRDQVDHIFSLLQARLSLEAVNRHNLMVGTAHTFQGEERDVMYLSLVVDRDAHPASFRFLNNPNVFNVSITRARNEQYVFCSLQPEDLCGDTLMRRYLTSITHGPKPSPVSRSGPPDAFLQQVRSELEQRGFHTWPAYPVAGMKIDLMVEQSGKTLGIDLIGYPGAFTAVFDLER
jgi:hypothetical protein